MKAKSLRIRCTSSRVAATMATLVLLAAPHALESVLAKSAPEKTTLFDSSEAAKLSYSEQDWKAIDLGRERKATVGPRIEIAKPLVQTSDNGPLIETRTPTDLQVIFQENGSPVRMDTLEITARKGIFSKSLTDKLKPFVKGSRLEAIGLDIPEGRFVIEIRVSDAAGHETDESYRIQVSAG